MLGWGGDLRNQSTRHGQDQQERGQLGQEQRRQSVERGSVGSLGSVASSFCSCTRNKGPVGDGTKAAAVGCQRQPRTNITTVLCIISTLTTLEEIEAPPVPPNSCLVATESFVLCRTTYADTDCFTRMRAHPALEIRETTSSAQFLSTITACSPCVLVSRSWCGVPRPLGSCWSQRVTW